MTGVAEGDGWAARYAEALDQVDGAGLRLSAEEAEVVLELARLVAHGTERRNAPLAAFLAGRFVQQRVSAGADAEGALGDAVARAQTVVPDPSVSAEPPPQ